LAQGKQHTPEFEGCIQEVMKQGHHKGSAFAICTESFQRAGKPIFVGEAETQKLHLFSESIKIEGNKVSGVAIHPKRIFHPEEGLEHVYLREELERAAPTLVGKPFGIDHMYILPPPNVITNAWYDAKQDGVAFEGIVNDSIAEQIRNKAFKGLSIELNWLKPGGKVEYVNGVAARNFELTSVHFLKRFPPGDKDAYIRLWEQLVVGPPLPLDQRVDALEKQIQEILNQINVINGKLEVLVSRSPSAIGIPAQPGPSQTIGVENMNPDELKKLVESRVRAVLKEQEDEREKLRQAQRERAQKYGVEPKEGGHLTKPSEYENIPEDQFADPVNWRYPVDREHVRAALTYFNQADNRRAGGYTHEEAVKIMTKIIQATLNAGVEVSYQPEDPVYRDLPQDLKAKLKGYEQRGEEGGAVSESEDVVALRKRIVDLEAKLAESEKAKTRQTEALKRKYADFRRMVESAIPPSHIWKAWRPGSQMMVQQLLRALRESSES